MPKVKIEKERLSHKNVKFFVICDPHSRKRKVESGKEKVKLEGGCGRAFFLSSAAEGGKVEVERQKCG